MEEATGFFEVQPHIRENKALSYARLDVAGVDGEGRMRLAIRDHDSLVFM